MTEEPFVPWHFPEEPKPAIAEPEPERLPEFREPDEPEPEPRYYQPGRIGLAFKRPLPGGWDKRRRLP